MCNRVSLRVSAGVRQDESMDTDVDMCVSIVLAAVAFVVVKLASSFSTRFEEFGTRSYKKERLCPLPTQRPYLAPVSNVPYPQ